MIAGMLREGGENNLAMARTMLEDVRVVLPPRPVAPAPSPMRRAGADTPSAAAAGASAGGGGAGAVGGGTPGGAGGGGGGRRPPRGVGAALVIEDVIPGLDVLVAVSYEEVRMCSSPCRALDICKRLCVAWPQVLEHRRAAAGAAGEGGCAMRICISCVGIPFDICKPRCVT